MVNILLPDNRQRRLVFYLAMEEYIAKETDWDDAFFFWRVPPTVIIGRNQNIASEVNLAWCGRNGVQVYRRKSGGGCVYSDMGNLMISYVTSGGNVCDVFSDYLNMISDALLCLGTAAKVSGRNDILIDGKKVSGNAFHSLGHRSVVHGTLLFNTDFDALDAAITPPISKVSSKGIPSVRQRVANLKPLFGAKAEEMGVTDMESLIAYLSERLCTMSRTLSAEQMARISVIESDYLDPGFIAGNASSYSFERKCRIENCGELCARISLKDALIDDISFSGDYFLLSDKDFGKIVTSYLKGLPWHSDSIMTALKKIDTESFIMGLDAEKLYSLLIEKND